LLNRTTLSKDMGSRGREKTLFEYNVSRIADDMEKLYRSLIK
jgi:hypothetical protein